MRLFNRKSVYEYDEYLENLTLAGNLEVMRGSAQLKPLAKILFSNSQDENNLQQIKLFYSVGMSILELEHLPCKLVLPLKNAQIVLFMCSGPELDTIYTYTKSDPCIAMKTTFSYLDTQEIDPHYSLMRIFKFSPTWNSDEFDTLKSRYIQLADGLHAVFNNESIYPTLYNYLFEGGTKEKNNCHQFFFSQEWLVN